MARIYSTYEAKAKFSELLRRVRSGERVTVTYRGEEVAEILPLEPRPSREERLRRLEEQGVLEPPRGPSPPLQPISTVPGGLRRFLESRE